MRPALLRLRPTLSKRSALGGLLLFGATALTSLSGVVGCSEPKVSMASGAREYVASDYPVVLKRWTRTENLILLAEIDNLLTVTATFESWDFRWAYVVRYAQDYRLTVDQRRALLEKTLGDTQEAHHFYIALYGNNRRQTDLTKPNSAWIVRLIDDQGNETAPQKIELIAKPSTLEQTYFPYTSIWRHAFRITFPRSAGDGRSTIAPDAKWFGLRFAGAEGNEELRWEVDTPEAQRAAFGDSVSVKAF